MHKWILAAALLLASPAAAQVTLEVSGGPELPPGEPFDLALNVTVTCLTLLTSGGTVDVEISSTAAPAWLNLSADPITVSGTSCVGTSARTDVTVEGAVTLVPASDAPGLTPADLPLTATAAGAIGNAVEGSATAGGLFVGYQPGHTISHGTQTFEVTGNTHAFNLSMAVTANARTMIMFEDRVYSPGATVTGLTAFTFDVAGGEREATLALEFQAQGAWDNATVTFRNFSHCIPEQVTYDCPEQMVQNVTWTFVRTGSGGTDSGGKEDSPGVGVALLAAALGAVVLLRRRR